LRLVVARRPISTLPNKREGFFEVHSMLTNRAKTKILVDGGDPEETLRIKSLIGFVDGQTTNPSLIAKNPEIQRRLSSGHKLSEQEEKDAYKEDCAKHLSTCGRCRRVH